MTNATDTPDPATTVLGWQLGRELTASSGSTAP
jgi:hypothetical protein